MKKTIKKKRKGTVAEGWLLPIEKPNKIRVDILKAIPYKGESSLVTYKTSEFSAVCPFSGLPDIATVVIEYIPKRWIVELKSLKYYFLSYRNVGIYQEEATSRIFQDLYTLLKPKYMKVHTVYHTRGGIDASCHIEKGKRSP